MPVLRYFESGEAVFKPDPPQEVDGVMSNEASSIELPPELSLTPTRTSMREALLARLHISPDRGVAHANALFALSMIVWGVVDSLIGDGPVVLPIGAVLAFVFYRFAVELSKGDTPSARWLRVSGRTSAAFAVSRCGL